MAYLVRRWIAREGHESVLRAELIGAYEEHVARDPGTMESMVYREHFLGREFIGLMVYDDDSALHGERRRALIQRFEAIAAAHAEVSEGAFSADLIYEFTSIARNAPYGLAALLRCDPRRVEEFSARLRGIAAAAVERVAAPRVLVFHLGEPQGLVLFLADASVPVDLDRYLRSSFWRGHRELLEPLLAAPPRWYLLDPIWHYFRRQHRR
jgi:hypothetical protein